MTTTDPMRHGFILGGAAAAGQSASSISRSGFQRWIAASAVFLASNAAALVTSAEYAEYEVTGGDSAKDI